MHIVDFVETYARYKNLVHSSKRHFRFVAKLFIKDTNISHFEDISNESFVDWRETVLGRKAKPETWNNYLRHIRAMINLGNSRKFFLCESDPIDLYARSHSKAPKTISLNDLKKVLRYLESGQTTFRPNWFWIALIRVFFYTGARRRQIAGLRWKDIDFELKEIYLSSQSSKNLKGWTIPAADAVLKELEIVRRHTLEVVGADENFDDRYVFDISLFRKRFKCKGKMTLVSISNLFYRLGGKSGVVISSHRLRHTFATILAQQGRYRDLQKLMGHKSINTTMVYVHPDLESARQLLNHLDDSGI